MVVAVSTELRSRATCCYFLPKKDAQPYAQLLAWKTSLLHFLLHIFLILRSSCHPPELLNGLGTILISYKLLTISASFFLLAPQILSVPLLSSSSSNLHHCSRNFAPQRTSLVDARGTDPSLSALGPRCRHPGDAASSGVRAPPLFGFRPPFLHELLHFFPFLRTTQVPPPRSCPLKTKTSMRSFSRMFSGAPRFNFCCRSTLMHSIISGSSW